MQAELRLAQVTMDTRLQMASRLSGSDVVVTAHTQKYFE